MFEQSEGKIPIAWVDVIFMFHNQISLNRVRNRVCLFSKSLTLLILRSCNFRLCMHESHRRIVWLNLFLKRNQNVMIFLDRWRKNTLIDCTWSLSRLAKKSICRILSMNVPSCRLISCSAEMSSLSHIGSDLPVHTNVDEKRDFVYGTHIH